ncbi:hypothetical protein MLD38_030122 [Melastoma candidum]|uniref:Uncharacterized protein n=1 Tax=Melastoma candidum TaxID=119954 RepID=A0ACB9MKV2_9MYRT|nr:hypothetical protein MLD38_030122 [Melastoma candidum]
MRPNWELRNCYNHNQVEFLIAISVCTVVILALWRTILLKPFKLVTVFLHEASHAIACKLTCGSVRWRVSRFTPMKVEAHKRVAECTG